MGNLTIKQEKFCQEYHKTGNASEAYRRAYDAKNMKPESINRKAKDVSDNVKVRARVKELQKAAEDKYKITVDDLIVELEEARKIGLSAETPQASAAVSATMGKAKLLGMIVDKVDAKVNAKVTTRELTDEELEAEIVRLEHERSTGA